jgi:hypothetical protein
MGEEINPPVPLPGTRTGSCQPVTSRPHNQVALEFRNGHQHVEERPGTSSGGINPLTQGQQPHTLVLQIISDLLVVSRQTTESIRLGHHEGVAVPGIHQRPVQSRCFVTVPEASGTNA